MATTAGAYRDSGINRQCEGATVIADSGCEGNPEVIVPTGPRTT